MSNLFVDLLFYTQTGILGLLLMSYFGASGPQLSQLNRCTGQWLLATDHNICWHSREELRYAEPNHRPVIWDQGNVAAESTIVVVPEHKKLKDIKYLHPFESKKKEWLVIVKVLKIDRSWWYNACKKCLRTTKPHGDTYKCTNNSCDSIGSPTPRLNTLFDNAKIHRYPADVRDTTPHQGDNLLLGTEIIPALPNVQTPSGAHNTPCANTLRLLPLKLANSQADAYSVLDGSTNKTHKSVTGKRSRTSPSKKAAKKLFRDEGITDDDAAGSTDVMLSNVVVLLDTSTTSYGSSLLGTEARFWELSSSSRLLLELASLLCKEYRSMLGSDWLYLLCVQSCKDHTRDILIAWYCDILKAKDCDYAVVYGFSLPAAESAIGGVAASHQSPASTEPFASTVATPEKKPYPPATVVEEVMA
ncbi:hypothetical protein Zm00014a_030103 [Zea mays]|uniref:Replication protein n=1 Tax=Zea mays TaxID=4577 RepID=A0A3L6D8I3_MAIZE|nr:hypothetical protein Zm00014a_030103 [Zea mays]